MNIKPRGPRPTCPAISPQSYAKIKDEVAGLYPREHPDQPQNHPNSYRGGDALNFVHDDNDKGDIDRQTGQDVHLYPDTNLLGRPCWSFECRQNHGLKVNKSWELDTPAGFSVDDLTYDSSSQRIVVQSYNQGSRDWELREFQLDSNKDWRGRPKGTVIHRDQQPFESIEFDGQGQLLAAREGQVQRLKQGQWEQVFEGQLPVQDLQTLSDGGLVVRIKTEGPTRYDLLYQAPGEQDFALLPLPAEIQESRSPDGQKSVAFKEKWPWLPLHARTNQQELGSIHDGRSLPRSTPFQDGYDVASMGWSQDSRFFKVTSNPIDKAITDVRDTLIWDSQAQKTYVLAGVQQVNFTYQGDLQLSAPGQSLTVAPQELEELANQPWQEKLAAMPVVISELPHWGARAYYRSGQLKTLIDNQTPRELGLTSNGEYLVAIHPDHKAADVFNLTNGVEAQIRDCRFTYWDPENRELGVVSGDPPQLDLLQDDQLGSSPWFRRALQQEVLNTLRPPSGQVVVQDQDGEKTFNGLKLPKRHP